MCDLEFLELAKAMAEKSATAGGRAIGSLLVKGSTVAGQGYDRTRQLNDPIAIAELDCLRNAGRRNDYAQLTLYSTHAPNLLVAGVVIQFGIGKLVVGNQGHFSETVLNLLNSKHIPVTLLER